jgi:hypothetical protein
VLSATTTLVIASTVPTSSPSATKPVVGSETLGSAGSKIGVRWYCLGMLVTIAGGFVVYL